VIVYSLIIVNNILNFLFFFNLSGMYCLLITKKRFLLLYYERLNKQNIMKKRILFLGALVGVFLLVP